MQFFWWLIYFLHLGFWEKCELSPQAQMCTWLKFQIQHTLAYFGGRSCCTLAWETLEGEVFPYKSQKAFLKIYSATPHTTLLAYQVHALVWEEAEIQN